MPHIWSIVLALATLNASVLAQDIQVLLDGSKIRGHLRCKFNLSTTATAPSNLKKTISPRRPPSWCRQNIQTPTLVASVTHSAGAFDRYQRVRFTCEFKTQEAIPVTWSLITLGDARSNYVLTVTTADAQSSFAVPTVDGVPTHYETRTWVGRDRSWHAIEATIETGSEPMGAQFSLSSQAGPNALFLRNVRIAKPPNFDSPPRSPHFAPTNG